jgi:hypothetical protein
MRLDWLIISCDVPPLFAFRAWTPLFFGQSVSSLFALAVPPISWSAGSLFALAVPPIGWSAGSLFALAGSLLAFAVLPIGPTYCQFVSSTVLQPGLFVGSFGSSLSRDAASVDSSLSRDAASVDSSLSRAGRFASTTYRIFDHF